MKAWLRKWLGVSAEIERLERAAGANVSAELEKYTALDDTIKHLREDLDGAGDGLVATRGVLEKVVKQLNANTTTMSRWATQSATLASIEAKYRAAVRREAHEQQIVAEAAEAAAKAAHPMQTVEVPAHIEPPQEAPHEA